MIAVRAWNEKHVRPIRSARRKTRMLSTHLKPETQDKLAKAPRAQARVHAQSPVHIDTVVNFEPPGPTRAQNAVHAPPCPCTSCCARPGRPGRRAHRHCQQKLAAASHPVHRSLCTASSPATPRAHVPRQPCCIKRSLSSHRGQPFRLRLRVRSHACVTLP